MTKQEFETKLQTVMTQEKEYNVKIDIPYIIDENHLDCTWYGGDVGMITTADNWKIVISAIGDIRINGIVNGEEFSFVDKNNGGSAYKEFGKMFDDDSFYTLINSDDEKNYLNFDNNNWFEVDLISPCGEFIDLFDFVDNVLDNNLLNCFADVPLYLEYIETYLHS